MEISLLTVRSPGDGRRNGQAGHLRRGTEKGEGWHPYRETEEFGEGGHLDGSPCRDKFIEGRSGTAKRITSSAHRLNDQRMRVVAMVVLSRLTWAIGALEFSGRAQIAERYRAEHRRGRSDLRELSANTARGAPTAFYALVFMRPAFNAARRTSDALLTFFRRRPYRICAGYRGGPFARNPRSPSRHGHRGGRHQAALSFSGFSRCQSNSSNVNLPPEASIYFRALSADSRRYLPFSSDRYPTDVSTLRANASRSSGVSSVKNSVIFMAATLYPIDT